MGVQGGEMVRDRKEGLSEDVLGMIAERFKLLSEPMRLKLLYALMGGEKSVSELREETGGVQANVSKHLGMLFDAGMIDRRKQGTSAYYRITDETVYELCDLVCGSIHDRLETDLGRFTPAATSRR